MQQTELLFSITKQADVYTTLNQLQLHLLLLQSELTLKVAAAQSQWTVHFKSCYAVDPFLSV